MSTFKFLTARPATIYLFPGQGSQEVGMAADLVANFPAAKAVFEEADSVLGFPLSSLCFDGPEEGLTDTINAQPALLTTSVATLSAIAAELGNDWPTVAAEKVFLAGHSMGEYSALVAGGSVTFADGLRLVRERGRLMKKAGEQSPGMMAAILGLDEESVSAICADVTDQGGIAQIANDNCPGQIVISGDRGGMEAAMNALSTAGARKVVPLAVSIAAHSPLMEPAAEELRAAIDATPIKLPIATIIGNTSATPLTNVEAIRAELTAQLTGSVRWSESMRFALDAGVTDFIEIGPGGVLATLMKRIHRKSKRSAVSDVDSVATFIEAFE